MKIFIILLTKRFVNLPGSTMKTSFSSPRGTAIVVLGNVQTGSASVRLKSIRMMKRKPASVAAHPVAVKSAHHARYVNIAFYFLVS